MICRAAPDVCKVRAEELVAKEVLLRQGTNILAEEETSERVIQDILISLKKEELSQGGALNTM